MRTFMNKKKEQMTKIFPNDSFKIINNTKLVILEIKLILLRFFFMFSR